MRKKGRGEFKIVKTKYQTGMSDRLPLLSVFMNIQQDKSGKGRTQTNVRLNKEMAAPL